MKAVVLTFDKNIKIAEHTIYTYEKLWPNNPFTFRIPYQKYPDFLNKKYGNKVELINTESPIKSTVLKLLEDLDDGEWIYWCMDDRYIIKLKVQEANHLYQYVKTNQDPTISSIRLIRMNRSYTSDKFLKKDGDLIINKNLKLKESIFSDTEQLEGLWQPQFLRVKLLRRVFASFPDRDFRAKEMDSFPKLKLKGEKLYIPEKTLIVVGESTHRGELTENCLASFTKWGLEIPDSLKVTKKYMVQGELPYTFMSIDIKLPRQIQSKITSLTRWYWRNKSNFQTLSQNSQKTED
jgi:hypothetical protein